MKELKFRAWYDGQMWEVTDICFSNDEKNYYHVDLWDKENRRKERVSRHCVALEQFTGIHDKNGKEIYEGDNVRDEAGNIAPIIWNECDCSFIVDFEMGCEQLDFSAKDWAEIIGTIHDPR